MITSEDGKQFKSLAFRLTYCYPEKQLQTDLRIRLLDEEWRNRMRIEQYIRCYHQWEKLNELSWQVPSLAFTLTGVLIGVAYQFTPQHPRLVLIVFNIFLIYMLIIHFVKNRLFLEGLTEFMKELEAYFEVRVIPLRTPDLFRFVVERRRRYSYLKKIIISRSAFNSLLLCLFVMLAGLIVLLCLESSAIFGALIST